MGIPVMGHLGLTPQAVHRSAIDARPKIVPARNGLLKGESNWNTPGVSLVLEHVPARLWRGWYVGRLHIPVIGIGAGDDCDGQISVTADLLGLTPQQPPFSPALIPGQRMFVEALRTWVTQQKSVLPPEKTSDNTRLLRALYPLDPSCTIGTFPGSTIRGDEMVASVSATPPDQDHPG